MRSRGILSHACGNLGSTRRAAAHLPLDRIRRRLSGRCVGQLIRGIPVTERPGGSSSRTWLKRTIARFLSRSPLCIDAMTMHFSVGGAPRCRRERSVGRCRTRRGRRVSGISDMPLSHSQLRCVSLHHLTLGSRSSCACAEFKLALVKRMAPVSIWPDTCSPLAAAKAVLTPS